MNAEHPGTHGSPAEDENEPWRQLYRYWLSKHVDGRLPAREDLDPITEIPRLVANLMIMDFTGNKYVYGFVGTEVVAHTGQDMTGKPVGMSRKYSPIQTQWLAALDAVRIDRRPSLLGYRFDIALSARQLVLLLPLYAAPGTAPRILGGSFFDGYFPPDLQAEGLSIQELPR